MFAFVLFLNFIQTSNFTLHSKDCKGSEEMKMDILDEISGTTTSVSDYGSNLSVDDVNVNSVENFIVTDICSHEHGNYGTIFDFDMSQRLTWPCSEVKDVGVGTCQDIVLIDETIFNPNDALLACPTQQNNSLLDKGVDDEHGYFGAVDEDYCSPCLYIMSWQEMISPYWPPTLSGEPQKGLPITLVLDLDETLVHSSFDSCKDADFSFSIHSQMQVQTVFVRQRPYLQIFLEAVASMFDIVIFTAGQSIYAKQLLDILDPNQTLICQRVYRDSCVFTDGGYLKDLTILGRDLARIAIVDNTPQVFQLQVENGIPIESWFGDPSDSALLSLLFFLETLIGAEDVRPIIKKNFGSNANP